MLAVMTRRLHAVPCTLTVLLALFVSGSPAAQSKRALTHDDYDAWKSLGSTTYSSNGKWMAFTVNPDWGDGVMMVQEVDGDTVHEHERGSSPRFSPDNRYVVFTIAKSKVEERRKKIAELREKGETSEKPEPSSEQRPSAEMMRRFRQGRGGRRGWRGSRGSSSSGGELAVLDLESGEVEVIGKVKGSRMPDEGAYLIYHLDKPEDKEKDKEAADGEESAEKSGEAEETQGERRRRPNRGRRSGRGRPEREPGASEGEGAENAKAEEKEDEEKDPLEKKRKDGTTLVVRDLSTGDETRFEHVVGYGLTGEDDGWLYYYCSKKEHDESVDYGLHARRLGGAEKVTLVDGFADFRGFNADDEGGRLAFFSNKETFGDEEPKNDLYLWSFSPEPARRVVYTGRKGIPDGKSLTSSGVGFSADGSVLTFGVRGEEEDLPKILSEEQVKLDIWHWKDGDIQPMQAKRGSSAGNPTWSCAYHIEDDRITVLGDDRIPSMSLITPDGSRALASDDTPYEIFVQWDSSYADVYLVNTLDGSRKKIIEKLRGRAQASETGKYVIYFGTDYHWHTIDVESLEHRNLTESIPVPFDRWDDDHPHPNPSYGTAGWTKDDREVVLYDEFDLWRINPKTGEAVCVTDGMGRANNIRFRYSRIDREWDEDHLPDALWLEATNTETMAQGFYQDSLQALRKPERVVWMEKRLSSVTKPKGADRLFYTTSTFREFPDVWTSKLDFSEPRKLTDVGKQVDQFRWGDAELVRWVSTGGVPLKGVLVKPDNFDPNKKYPMMVYFYEKLSSNLHRFTTPSPGTSPNAAYYVSNGYLWFTPDIVYDEGYPGDSALKCVVSGVQAVIAKGFVDEASIGAAGHSWGGYQTAYLVTRTDIFAAVESGAPVSNMVSAYGGIRYSSGRSRQFQYEQTQSRIGGSLWEYPMRYWENSPIFFADKVNTPVLILHNDEDGAVPWTNGIEYFMALRRLGKESYLFNYVGAGHGLRKDQNKKDWARRMSEYFDHHLKGAPAPKWMTDGVPYHEREREKLRYVPSLLEASVEPPRGDPRDSK